MNDDLKKLTSLWISELTSEERDVLHRHFDRIKSYDKLSEHGLPATSIPTDELCTVYYPMEDFYVAYNLIRTYYDKTFEKYFISDLQPTHPYFGSGKPEIINSDLHHAHSIPAHFILDLLDETNQMQMSKKPIYIQNNLHIKASKDATRSLCSIGKTTQKGLIFQVMIDHYRSGDSPIVGKEVARRVYKLTQSKSLPQKKKERMKELFAGTDKANNATSLITKLNKKFEKDLGERLVANTGSGYYLNDDYFKIDLET